MTSFLYDESNKVCKMCIYTISLITMSIHEKIKPQNIPKMKLLIFSITLKIETD